MRNGLRHREVFDPLLAGSVPVYLGAPNVEDFAPGDGCYINATDSDGPRQLAECLTELDRDPRLYQRLLRTGNMSPCDPASWSSSSANADWPTHMVDAANTILARISMKTVLILYENGGTGHKRAAELLESMLASEEWLAKCGGGRQRALRRKSVLLINWLWSFLVQNWITLADWLLNFS